MDSWSQTNTDIDNYQIAQALNCKPEECYLHIKSLNHLTILTQNIRSIYKNIDAFQVILHSLKFDCDVLIMTECHLSSNKTVPSLNNNYNTFFSVRTLNQCDGVILYIKKDIKCTITEPCIQNASCLVAVLSDIVIISIYRSPSIRNTDDFIASLLTLLEKFKSYHNIVIVGDINIDIKINSTDTNSPHYLTSLAYYGLLPAHRLPTRGKNCIDHMMLKTSLAAKSIVLENAPTDHSSVILNLKLNPIRHTVSKIKISVNYIKALDEIKNNLNDILIMSDANQSADNLVNRISTALKNNQTTTKVPSRKRCIQPWITFGVLRCLRNRDKLHLKVKKNPDNEILKITYTRYRNYCQTLVRKLKNNYERSNLENAKNNPKTLWKNIKSICYMNKDKSTNINSLLTLKPTPLASANHINTYFSNLGRKLVDNLISTSPNPTAVHPHTIHPIPLTSFALLNTDPDEIISIINSLSNDSAPGWDNISTTFVKMAKHILVPILCHVYNNCLESGHFPKAFKKAIVTPVHKGGGIDDVENYRPISVLTVFSKILEKIINNRLKKYLTDNCLLSNNQFGFRNGVSTEDAVLALTEEISKHLDRGNKCVGVFLDLAKAFDTVSTPLLLDKLYQYGIRGLPLQLISDFLTDRQQQTKLGNYLSQPTGITCGLPQGSVLSPTLFLIYVNDLCNFKIQNCKIYTYADDTALIFNAESWGKLKQTVERGISSVYNWLKDNLLTLNINKTKYLPFAIRKPNLPHADLDIKLHTCSTPSNNLCSCSSLNRCNNIKYLGIVIDQHLNWSQHIKTVADRMRKLIWVFKKLRNIANDNILKTTYNALAKSVLSYCISVWGGAGKSILISLERTQRALLKVAFKKPLRFSTFALHNTYKILTTRQIYILSSLIKTHRKLPYINNLPLKRRTPTVCQITHCKTKFKRKQFSSMSFSLYNKFNKKLNIYPLTRFKMKRLITTYLLDLNYEETELTIYSSNI